MNVFAATPSTSHLPRCKTHRAETDYAFYKKTFIEAVILILKK